MGEDAAFQRVCAELGQLRSAPSTSQRFSPRLIRPRPSKCPALRLRGLSHGRGLVSQDAAFNFYYEANLQWLRQWEPRWSSSDRWRTLSQ